MLPYRYVRVVRLCEICFRADGVYNKTQTAIAWGRDDDTNLPVKRWSVLHFQLIWQWLAEDNEMFGHGSPFPLQRRRLLVLQVLIIIIHAIRRRRDFQVDIRSLRGCVRFKFRDSLLFYFILFILIDTACSIFLILLLFPPSLHRKQRRMMASQ